MAELGVTEGDIIQISGKRQTASRIVAPYTEDEGLEVVRLDGLQRANAGAGAGDMVMLSRVETRPAARAVFAPAEEHLRLQGRSVKSGVVKESVRKCRYWAETRTSKKRKNTYIQVACHRHT